LYLPVRLFGYLQALKKKAVVAAIFVEKSSVVRAAAMAVLEEAQATAKRWANTLVGMCEELARKDLIPLSKHEVVKDLIKNELSAMSMVDRNAQRLLDSLEEESDAQLAEAEAMAGADEEGRIEGLARHRVALAKVRMHTKRDELTKAEVCNTAATKALIMALDTVARRTAAPLGNAAVKLKMEEGNSYAQKVEAFLRSAQEVARMADEKHRSALAAQDGSTEEAAGARLRMETASSQAQASADLASHANKVEAEAAADMESMAAAATKATEAYSAANALHDVKAQALANAQKAVQEGKSLMGLATVKQETFFLQTAEAEARVELLPLL
jgi:hypothetical protein